VVAFVSCKFKHSEDSSLSVSGKTFRCRRAVRQGDHLSPLLFILVPVFLQNIVNKATTLGLLTLPILSLGCTDFPIPQNVYDTVIIMEVSTK
jgi:hypothetical protein